MIKNQKKLPTGFTIIELIVTIVIIGILATLVRFVPTGLQKTARDQEREDDVTAISRRLEQGYANQELGTPSYPSTTELANDISTKTRLGARIQVDAYRAPNATASSIVSATTTSTTTPTGNALEPTISQYIYQPLTSTGTLCTANPSTATQCIRYTLYYRTESDNVVHKIRSLHQQ